MARQIRLDLDDELEREPTDMATLLDRIPGSWERMQLGREQARKGETIGLDEL